MIEAGKRYELTKTNSKTGETVTFTAKISWVEDRGDSWYVGFEPDNWRICQWGCFGIKKEGRYKAINWTFKEVVA